MKKSLAVILASVMGAVPGFTHEAEGGSTAGLFGLKPEYVHVLLNPLPVYGLALGAFVLAWAMVARGKTAQLIGLVLIVICATAAWPVFYYGQHAYNDLFPKMDTDSQRWLKEHMERAERVIYIFYVTAACGFAALVLRKRFPKTGSALAALALAGALVSVGTGAWISRAGGQVRHPEFRKGGVPPPPARHEKEETGGIVHGI